MRKRQFYACHHHNKIVALSVIASPVNTSASDLGISMEVQRLANRSEPDLHIAAV